MGMKSKKLAIHDIFRLAKINGIYYESRKTSIDLFEPMLVIADAGGPINTIPALFNFSAKEAFSLRKP